MIFAVDVGGTTTRYGLFEDPRSLAPPVWLVRRKTQKLYSRFLSALRELQHQRAMTPNGLGLSIGVAFSSDGRSVRASSKMPDFEGRQLAADCEQIFGCPVRTAHDCVCALGAEQALGGAPVNAGYVTVSSGTGGAVSLGCGDGRVLFRSRLAHQIVDMDGPACHCGQRGCLAAFTDGLELRRTSGTALRDIHDEAFWSRFIDALAVGLVNLSWLYPIERIIVGGGIALRNPFVRSRLAERFARRRLQGRQATCSISFAALAWIPTGRE